MNIAGEESRYVFQGVHMLFDGTAEEFKAIRQEVLSRFPDADVPG